jgi:hypothetical protein
MCPDGCRARWMAITVALTYPGWEPVIRENGTIEDRAIRE